MTAPEGNYITYTYNARGNVTQTEKAMAAMLYFKDLTWQ